MQLGLNGFSRYRDAHCQMRNEVLQATVIRMRVVTRVNTARLSKHRLREAGFLFMRKEAAAMLSDLCVLLRSNKDRLSDGNNNFTGGNYNERI